MTTLNKYASEICRKYDVHACTDVTGFSFLGHLHEMLDGKLNCCIDASEVPVIEEAHRHDERISADSGRSAQQKSHRPICRVQKYSILYGRNPVRPADIRSLLAAVKAEQAEHWKLNYKMQPSGEDCRNIIGKE